VALSGMHFCIKVKWFCCDLAGYVSYDFGLCVPVGFRFEEVGNLNLQNG